MLHDGWQVDAVVTEQNLTYRDVGRIFTIELGHKQYDEID